MQITADSNGVYTKVFSLSPYQNFDVIRQWSVQWCLMSGPSCLLLKLKEMITASHKLFIFLNSDVSQTNEMPVKHGYMHLKAFSAIFQTLLKLF